MYLVDEGGRSLGNACIFFPEDGNSRLPVGLVAIYQTVLSQSRRRNSSCLPLPEPRISEPNLYGLRNTFLSGDDETEDMRILLEDSHAELFRLRSVVFPSPSRVTSSPFVIYYSFVRVTRRDMSCEVNVIEMESLGLCSHELVHKNKKNHWSTLNYLVLFTFRNSVQLSLHLYRGRSLLGYHIFDLEDGGSTVLRNVGELLS